MAEPQSIKNEPFSDFPRQSYSIIGDDFCHEKLLTIKPTVKTANSVIKLKEVVASKGGKFSFSDETKLWFNLPKSGSIYAKIKSGDYIKVHYDDGVRNISGKNVYLYSAVNFNRSLDLLALKVGVGHDSEHCHTDNRVKVSLEKGAQRYFWYNRTLVNHGNFKFGLVTSFDICNKVLQKNNVLLGYNIDSNTQAFIRAEVDGFRSQNANLRQPESVFDKVTLDLVRKFKDATRTTTVGVEVQIFLSEVGYNIRSGSINNVQAVALTQNASRESFKIGVNQDLNINLLVKKPLSWWNNFATVSLGAGISGLAKKSPQVKTGLELALNL